MLKVIKNCVAFLLLGLFVALFTAVPSASAIAAVITPNNTQGWNTADTRPGGTVSLYKDDNARQGVGALKLSTNDTTSAKAQYMHAANIPVSQIAELSYWTKQINGPAHAAASFQLAIDIDGPDNSTGFTTFVYEPYQNGTVTKGNWQNWDVDAGRMWSSRSLDCNNADFSQGTGGAPFYDISQIKACSEAVVVGYGVNIGSYNASYEVAADLIVVNDTNYDFEFQELGLKEACKDGGWNDFSASSNYKNQGQCVSKYASGDGNVSSVNVMNYRLDSSKPEGADVPVKKDTWHKIAVSGTWTNRGSETVDAECTSWQGGPWKNEVTGDYKPDLLDVQINSKFVKWGDCDNTNHSYSKWVKTGSDKVNFRIFDGDVSKNQQDSGWFDDNKGELDVLVTSY